MGFRDVQQYTAVYEHRGEWWTGSVEELPGANTRGRTLEEARDHLGDAARLLLEVNRDLARQDAAGRAVIREPLLVATPE